MQYSSMPNFPLVITSDMIELYGERWNNEGCLLTFEYGAYWVVFAEKYGEMTHWKVTIASMKGTVCYFDAANEGENYGHNIGVQMIISPEQIVRTTPYNQSKKWLDRNAGRH